MRDATSRFLMLRSLFNFGLVVMWPAVLLAANTRPLVDLSTPKEAALSAMRCLEGGTLADIKATVLADDSMYEELEARAVATSAGENCVSAIKTVFGATAADDFAIGHGLGDKRRLDAVMNASAKVNGDSAVLDCGNIPGLNVKLKKVGGQWKMDMTDAQPDPGLAAIYKGASKVWNETALDIIRGKFKKVDEIDPAVSAKMDVAMAALPPTTAPATRPTTKPAVAPAAIQQ